MPATKAPIIVDSIGAAIRHHYAIAAHCSACRHMAPLDLSTLAARLGNGHGILAADLTPRLRCSNCGGRKVVIVIALDHAKARAGRPLSASEAEGRFTPLESLNPRNGAGICSASRLPRSRKKWRSLPDDMLAIVPKPAEAA